MCRLLDESDCGEIGLLHPVGACPPLIGDQIQRAGGHVLRIMCGAGIYPPSEGDHPARDSWFAVTGVGIGLDVELSADRYREVRVMFHRPRLSLLPQIPPAVQILHGVEDRLVDVSEHQSEIPFHLGVVESHRPAYMGPQVRTGAR